MTDAVKIKQINLNTLSKDAIRRLKKLTAGELGTMINYVRNYERHPSPHANAFVAIGKNHLGKTDILGWTLAHRPRKGTDYTGGYKRSGDDYKDWELNIWVSPKERGRGIARKLIHYTMEHAPKVNYKVYIFDKGNEKLYKGMGALNIKPNPDRGEGEMGTLNANVVKNATQRRKKLLAHGTIRNPKTDNDIKISTALQYDKKHPAYKAAKQKLDNL